MHNIKISYFLVVILVFGCLSCSTTQAENHADSKEQTPVEQQKMQEEMMKEWVKYATPGEEHKVLEEMVGEWDYKLTFWHTPDSEPELHEGTSRIKTIMDGRFVKHKSEATMNGQPFEGMGIVGYNNEKKQYQSVWIDNMGTGMMTATGKFDTEMNAIVEEGNYTCPLEDRDKAFSGVTKFISDDTFTYEWFTNDMEGNRYRAMEIVYTRKKS